ncbi:MAG: hypothetical protein NZM04_00495 [Methylacidiphilales bacterium]|nr:hypothetical protein [Candidatus Methylacidiphilales bacterium]
MLLTVETLKLAKRDEYGVLEINFEAALKAAYPDLKVVYGPPGCWGTSADLWFTPDGHLRVPYGRYRSRKHFHKAGHGILAVETQEDCDLNFAGKPLFLLMGWAYNGDYKSLARSYYLFGQNEDGSYFLHKVRPAVGELGSLEAARRWIWRLREGEVITARQGDLAFIPKDAPRRGFQVGATTLRLGRHQVAAEGTYRTKERVLVLNPIASHPEHHSVQLQGWFELRLGRAWQASSAD